MSRFLKAPFAGVFLLGTILTSPVFAQSASESNSRINQMEEQMRLLVGQVEELTFTVKQLQGQLNAGRKVGEAGAMQQPAAAPRKPVQQQAAIADDNNAMSVEDDALQQKPVVLNKPVRQKAPQSVDGGGIEQIEDVEQAPIAASEDNAAPVRKAPAAKMIGALGSTKPAAASGDGGFQGQLLVAPGDEGGDVNSGSVETVSLAPDTPEALYEKSNESLLRRQFGEAEQGFRDFVVKYPEHNLAGSAQYWLGETYYAQGQYRDAAKNFLSGYQQYPKSRRAPDSLLKLGISLNKLGQTQQACASLGAVGQQYPNAVDAKKRAQAEFRRAGC
jgi:tol-pal system protein YbgF